MPDRPPLNFREFLGLFYYDARKEPFMNVSMPTGIGAILAIIVLVLAILGLLHVLPASAGVVFGCLALLAVARLT